MSSSVCPRLWLGLLGALGAKGLPPLLLGPDRAIRAPELPLTPPVSPAMSEAEACIGEPSIGMIRLFAAAAAAAWGVGR